MAIAGGDLFGEFRATTRSRLRTEEPREQANPTLLLLRKTIENSFIGACETHAGQPTQEALEEAEWLTAKTDWTRVPGCPIPPPELREEFPGSFEWCCRWLNFDPDEVRAHGLPRQSCRAGVFHPTKVPKYAQKTRPRRDGKKHSLRFAAGLPAVFQAWKDAKADYDATESASQETLTARAGVATGEYSGDFLSTDGAAVSSLTASLVLTECPTIAPLCDRSALSS